MNGGTYRGTLRRPGLQPFLWTQLLCAFNHNACRIVVTLLAIQQFGVKTGGTLVGAFLILPFLIGSGYAGHVADVFSKQRVLVWTKGLEIAAMAAMVPALAMAQRGVTWPLLGVLCLIALQATFFSPAKYGIVPELMPDADLSRANGLLVMSTFVAIVLGTVAGGEMFQAWRGEPFRTGAVLVAIAVAGTLTSLRIPATTPANPSRRFALNPFGEIGIGIARLARDRNLAMTVVGLSFFWFLGTLIQLAVMRFGPENLRVGDAASTGLFTSLAVGVGVGSLVAGRLSGDKVEPGLVPLGGLGMGLFSLALMGAPTYWVASGALLMVGFFGGWFAVPLSAFVQQRPDEHERGRILATNNVVNTIGILAAAAVHWVLGERLGVSAGWIIVSAGLATLAATAYALTTLPDFFVRFSLWLLTHTVYRIRILGRPNIPMRGPAVIIANHISFIDGALIGACIQRFVRFLVWGPHFRQPGLHWLLERLHAIPVTAGNKVEVAEAIERARQELLDGHVVCVFVEGSVSRTGNLLSFKRGFERIVAGLDVPVIPVYLDRVWGSVFSFKRGRFFRKLPERLPYPVTVAFGEPLPPTVTALDARLALMELSVETMRRRRGETELLHIEFMRSAKRRWRYFAMADSTGQKLSYGRALVAALLLGTVIKRRTPAQSMIGLLLPASVGGALANIAVHAAGRTPVNLNFTIGQEALEAAMAQAGIQTVLTSKKFLAKANLPQLPSMVFLEDLRGDIGGVDKVSMLIAARVLPVALLRRWFGGRLNTDSVATIIFSSGSTGMPKGVMLTHRNILANVDALAQIFPVESSDCFIGVLPFFHSFGLTGTLWFPLLQGCGVAFHPNPMDAKTIGELAATYRGSMLISTPTFCHSYVRRCTREQFAHLRYAIVGAEKLREPLATMFEEQFGVPLLEGYGCTEMAPVVAVNRPNYEDGVERQIGMKFGSVGHAIPGVAAKVVDQETGEGPLYGRPGLLFVKGANMMAGYLGQPERTAEVIRNGWYSTGDIAMMDDDGFIFITDRLSRFSKIGGEMVPHLKVEEAINGVLGDLCSAVTAVPDPTRGERLVAFYTRQDVTPDQLWEELCKTDLPRLWLPRREHLVHIQEIPTLGTGKVDLRRLRQIALERAGAAVPQS